MSSDPLRSGREAQGLAFVLARPPTGVRVVDGTSEAYVARVQRSTLDDAYARGLAEGERRALERGASALDAAAERLDEARTKAQPELAATAIDLAIEIARAVVRCEIEAGHHGIEKIVRETLATSGVGRGACVVHVHPTDAERLKPIPFRTGTVIEADPEVAPGDVHVTTPHGVLVRDVDDVLAAVRDRLQAELT